jgi:hypothetical protein
MNGGFVRRIACISLLLVKEGKRAVETFDRLLREFRRRHSRKRRRSCPTPG